MKTYQQDPFLFARDSLGDHLTRRLREAKQVIDDWADERFLQRSPGQLKDNLLEQFRLTAPRLQLDAVEMLPATREIQSSQSSFSIDYGNAHLLHVRRFVVPFSGDGDTFLWRPSSYSLNPPTGTISSRPDGGGELTVSICYPDGSAQDATAIRAQVDRILSSVEQYLESARSLISRYEQELTQVADGISLRRAKVLQERKLEASLGFPVRRRQDAQTYAVPVTRKRLIRSQGMSSRPFEPEPAMSEDAYEEALGALRNGRNALERSPSMTATLDEEKIRDLLLLILNGQFEGRAGGEVFNGSGKTDILIREQDRNIFIAECKFWRGHKGVVEALDQMLSYLVWRDTKAALLLFVRQGKPTGVVLKAAAAVESHPNYKRTLRRFDEDAERMDVVMKANGDDDREITLALLPFMLGDHAPQNLRAK